MLYYIVGNQCNILVLEAVCELHSKQYHYPQEQRQSTNNFGLKITMISDKAAEEFIELCGAMMPDECIWCRWGKNRSASDGKFEDHLPPK